MHLWTLRGTLVAWGVTAAPLFHPPPFCCRLGGEGPVRALACCWPHPGGTICTHLNSPSQEVLGSRPVSDLGLAPPAGCSGCSPGSWADQGST